MRWHRAFEYRNQTSRELLRWAKPLPSREEMALSWDVGSNERYSLALEFTRNKKLALLWVIYGNR